MSLPKTMQNSDVREISLVIYHSKGLDESYPSYASTIKFEYFFNPGANFKNL